MKTMKNVRNTLLTAIMAYACSNQVVYAGSPDNEAREAEKKYLEVERVYRKRIEEKERERVVKQREMKNEQRKHREERTKSSDEDNKLELKEAE